MERVGTRDEEGRERSVEGWRGQIESKGRKRNGESRVLRRKERDVEGMH